MPRNSSRRAAARAGTLAFVAVSALALTALSSSPASARPAPVDLQILSFNDYHGNIEPPSGSNAAVPGLTGSYGGAAYLATTLKNLRSGKQHSLTVAAGDLIGASTIVSGLFKDEPSIETLNAMGLNVSSVGNHEFDEGVSELLRMQYGGCSPTDGCFDPDGYSGASFGYLAANVVYKDGVVAPRAAEGYGSWFWRRTGRTILPPTWVSEVDGIKVGFIGMTLEGTPELVAQAGIKDVEFKDEVVTANLAAADLRRRGVRAIVVLVHEGGLPPSSTPYNYACNDTPGGAAAISGPIVDIARNLDPSIDLVVSGHTHQPYACMIPDPAGRLRSVTSAYSYGRLVTETNLRLDRLTKDVIRSSVTSVNRPVSRTVTPDPGQVAVVSKWTALAAPIANRPVATIAADIKRAATRADESSLANLVADAQLERTRVNGAQIALMNPGGVRNDLNFTSSAAGEGDGVVTYGETFDVQPFGNTLLTMTMTGAQLDTVLEQQYAVRSGVETRLQLGVSDGLRFDQLPAASAPPGQRISQITLGGVPIDPAASYRVTVNSFLADGGDSFLEFKNGTDRTGGGVDLDEFVTYLGLHSPVSPPPTDRINELG